MQFLSIKPRNPAFGDLLLPSVGTILIPSPLMYNFALICLLTYLFQMGPAWQVIQTAPSNEFVFNFYHFITLCATGSFSPQEPSDLLHLEKC